MNTPFDQKLLNQAPKIRVTGVILVGERLDDGVPVLIMSTDIVSAHIDAPHGVLAVQVSQLAQETQDGPQLRMVRAVLADYVAAKPRRKPLNA